MKQKLAEFFHIAENDVVRVMVWGVLLTPLAFVIIYILGGFM